MTELTKGSGESVVKGGEKMVDYKKVAKFKEGKLPTDKENKIKYLYRLQEQLRLYHNTKGKQFTDKEISQGEFQNFKNWFKLRSSCICNEINKLKNGLTDKEKEKYLDKDEDGNYGPFKDKEKHKKDKETKTAIDDIEVTLVKIKN